MEEDASTPKFREGAEVGWEAALLEIEHQADHWDMLEHGANGRPIAEALRTAAKIAREGGLQCEHQGGPRPAGDPAFPLQRTFERDVGALSVSLSELVAHCPPPGSSDDLVLLASYR